MPDMELPPSDPVDLFMKLLPGFLATAAFHAYTPCPKRDVFERVIVRRFRGTPC
jgi:hypothetical protein